VWSWVFIIIGMIYLLIKDELLRFATSSKENLGTIVNEIQKLSVPTIVTQIIGPLTIMYLTWLIARQSELAVAAYGVAGRIETLLMIGVLAISSAITPFIAQNQGAHKKSRIYQAIVYGGKSSTYLGIVLCLLLYISIRPIASLFSENDEVISYTSNYFYFVSLSYVFYGLYIMGTAVFNGLKLTKVSLKLSAVKSFSFTIPLTLIGSYWGVKGIFIGVALSNLLAGIYTSIQIRKLEQIEFNAVTNRTIIQDYMDDIKWLFGKKN
jgi:Na+-driven multidrug efflux pump